MNDASQTWEGGNGGHEREVDLQDLTATVSALTVDMAEVKKILGVGVADPSQPSPPSPPSPPPKTGRVTVMTVMSMVVDLSKIVLAMSEEREKMAQKVEEMEEAYKALDLHVQTVLAEAHRPPQIEIPGETTPVNPEAREETRLRQQSLLRQIR